MGLERMLIVSSANPQPLLKCTQYVPPCVICMVLVIAPVLHKKEALVKPASKVMGKSSALHLTTSGPRFTKGLSGEMPTTIVSPPTPQELVTFTQYVLPGCAMIEGDVAPVD